MKKENDQWINDQGEIGKVINETYENENVKAQNDMVENDTYEQVK